MSVLFRCTNHGRVAIDIAGVDLLSAACPICRRAMAREAGALRTLIVPADTHARIEREAAAQGLLMGQVVDAYTIDLGGAL